MAGRLAELKSWLWANIKVSEEVWQLIKGALYKAHQYGEEEGKSEQKAIDIDKAVIWVDENVGTLTAIALRKHLEE